ncbi:entericidin A/B family lipoprotein [Sandarakinorhabdus rubra]
MLHMLPLLALLAACNTIEGAGRDISSVGKAMTKSAEETK